MNTPVITGSVLLLFLSGCAFDFSCDTLRHGNNPDGWVAKEACYCEAHGGWVNLLTPQGYCEMNQCTIVNAAGVETCTHYQLQIPVTNTTTRNP